LQTDKGKPGESRGRKAMGLTLLNELRLPGRRRSASKHHSQHRSNSEEAQPRRAWSTSQVLFCCSSKPIAPHHCQRYSATPLHHSRKAAPSQPTSQPATAASKPHRSHTAASSPPQRSRISASLPLHRSLTAASIAATPQPHRRLIATSIAASSQPMRPHHSTS